MVKYPLWKFGYKNYSIIRYNMRAAAVLIFDKRRPIYLRGRHTANYCKTAFSQLQLNSSVCYFNGCRKVNKVVYNGGHLGTD